MNYYILDKNDIPSRSAIFAGTLEQFYNCFGEQCIYKFAEREGQKVHQQLHTFLVNDGVSFGYGADSYPGTVVKVTPARVHVARDDYRCTKAPSAMGAHDGEYEFIQHKNAPVMIFTVKKDGRVTPIGETGSALSQGRKYYMDPSF